MIDFSRSHIGNSSTGFNISAFMNPGVLQSYIQWPQPPRENGLRRKIVELEKFQQGNLK